MVNSCCVTGCNNESYPGSRFSFHGLNENQTLKWENVVPGKISKSAVVCSAHFKCDDFMPGYIRKMLKPDAVPSIFPKVSHRTHKDHDYLIDVCEFSSFTAFVDRGGLKYASALVFDVVKYIEKVLLVMSPDLHSLNLKKMLNMTLHQFSPKIKRISPILPSSDETHELELIKCIGQKYLSLRLKSYGKSLTLKHMGDKATLRQKLHKTVLFSNV